MDDKWLNESLLKNIGLVTGVAFVVPEDGRKADFRRGAPFPHFPTGSAQES